MWRHANIEARDWKSNAPIATSGARSIVEPVCVVDMVISYSERRACKTSMRAARAAGISDAATAAVMSTAAATRTVTTPGVSVCSKNRAAMRASDCSTHPRCVPR